MPGRAVTIDEAIEKIGRFSRQDAIDLLESSHGFVSFNKQIGHPLQHCEITTRAWPIGRFQNPETLVENMPSPETAAVELDKREHTMAWTDQHLIQAVRDLFLGNGAFTALHHLKTKGIGARLIYSRPTSHTTNPIISTSSKVNGIRRHKSSADDKLTRSYKAILDHCSGGRLHLQTLYALPNNSQNVRIEVRPGHAPGDKSFLAEFAA